MPTLLPPELTTPERPSPKRSLPEENLLDQTTLSALRQFFLILDAWDRGQDKNRSVDVQSPVDNPSHQAQGDPGKRILSRRVR